MSDACRDVLHDLDSELLFLGSNTVYSVLAELYRIFKSIIDNGHVVDVMKANILF